LLVVVVAASKAPHFVVVVGTAAAVVGTAAAVVVADVAVAVIVVAVKGRCSLKARGSLTEG
jgi:hypothetical protein